MEDTEYMDDIQFAFSVSDKLGKLYRDAKTFSDQAPELTLTHLRGLAYAVCDMLDRDASDDVFLAKRIKNLEHRSPESLGHPPAPYTFEARKHRCSPRSIQP